MKFGRKGFCPCLYCKGAEEGYPKASDVNPKPRTLGVILPKAEVQWSKCIPPRSRVNTIIGTSGAANEFPDEEDLRPAA